MVHVRRPCWVWGCLLAYFLFNSAKNTNIRHSVGCYQQVYSLLVSWILVIKAMFNFKKVPNLNKYLILWCRCLNKVFRSLDICKRFSYWFHKKGTMKFKLIVSTLKFKKYLLCYFWLLSIKNWLVIRHMCKCDYWICL